MTIPEAIQWGGLIFCGALALNSIVRGYGYGYTVFLAALAAFQGVLVAIPG